MPVHPTFLYESIWCFVGSMVTPFGTVTVLPIR